MKLILVSQDKTIQHEYDGLVLCNYSYKGCYVIKDKNKEFVYARYTSKDKAQEVMNDVINFLKTEENIKRNYFVYEFPKDVEE